MSLKIDALILAAGSSSRMGEPKQLLQYQGKTFVEYVCDQAIATDVRHVHLVLGAYHDLIIPLIKDKPISYHINIDWSKGMGTSIALGVESLLDLDIPDGLLIILVDQPKIEKEDLNFLISEFQENPNCIITSKVSNSFGPPIIFPVSMFNTLINLKGDQGAKSIIKCNSSLDIITIDLGDRTKDIDTPDAYKALCS